MGAWEKVRRHRHPLRRAPEPHDMALDLWYRLAAAWLHWAPPPPGRRVDAFSRALLGPEGYGPAQTRGRSLGERGRWAYLTPLPP